MTNSPTHDSRPGMPASGWVLLNQQGLWHARRDASGSLWCGRAVFSGSPVAEQSKLPPDDVRCARCERAAKLG